MNYGTKRRAGFTLVELLVVIAIIGVLVGLLLPAVQAAREAGRRSSCQNNLRQFGIALQNYHDSFEFFPRSGYLTRPGMSTNPYPAYHHTWITSLLPFIEQNPLYSTVNFSLPAYGQPFTSAKIKLFHCPSDAGLRDASETHGMAHTNYAGSEGYTWTKTQVYDASTIFPKRADYAGLFAINRTFDMANLKDGASNTVVIAEVDSYAYEGGAINTSGTGKRRLSVDAVFRSAFVFTPYAGDAADGSVYKKPDDSGAASQDTWFKDNPKSFTPTYTTAYGLCTNWPGASSMHSGGIVLGARADGSVSNYRKNMNWQIWLALNGLNDGVPTSD